MSRKTRSNFLDLVTMPHKSHFFKNIYDFGKKNSEKQQNLLEKIWSVNIALHCIHTTFLVDVGFIE